MFDKRKNITTGISLSKEIWNKIDQNRGDISRSRYVLRLIEKSMEKTESLGKLSAK
jgi:hypothetical protein